MFPTVRKRMLRELLQHSVKWHEARVAPRPVTSHRPPPPVTPAWRRVGSAYLGSESFALSGSGRARLGPSAPDPGVATAGRGLVLGPDTLSRLLLRRVHSRLLACPEPGSWPVCVTSPAWRSVCVSAAREASAAVARASRSTSPCKSSVKMRLLTVIYMFIIYFLYTL